MSPRLMPAAIVAVSAMSVTKGLSWEDAAMSSRRMPAVIMAVAASSMTIGLWWAHAAMSPRLLPPAMVAGAASSLTGLFNSIKEARSSAGEMGWTYNHTSGAE